MTDARSYVAAELQESFAQGFKDNLYLSDPVNVADRRLVIKMTEVPVRQ